MNWLNKRKNRLFLKQIKDLFYLPRADRKVLLAFSLCLAVLTGAALLYLTHLPAEKGYLLTEAERRHYQELCRSLETGKEKPSRKKTFEKKPYSYAVATTPWASFPFDPNTADSTQLLALGFAPWQVRNIYKYRAKGGRFRQAEEIRKIYGMTGELLEHLMPLVRIAPKYQYLDTPAEESEKQHSPKNPSNKFTEKTCVDLNTADTALLKRIPGIGHGFASQIVRRRQNLGGYTSVEQLKEIPHFPDSLLSWFEIGDLKSIQKININKATLTEMRRHPYLNFYQCRTILEHRRKYGTIKSLNDLSLYEEFTAKDLDRLTPYLRFQ